MFNNPDESVFFFFHSANLNRILKLTIEIIE